MAADTSERFRTQAADRGVDITVAEFPAGTRTAEDAAAAVGCPVDAIVKSLVFVVDERAVLALTAGRNRVDEQRLAAATGASRARRATPDEVRRVTGYAIGGTPPFGHSGEGVTDVIMDPSLLAHEEVWAAAGTPSSVFAITPGRLAEVAGARVVDVTVARS